MIKGYVTVTGRVAKEASAYTNPKGEKFWDTLILVHIPNKEGEASPLWIKAKIPQTFVSDSSLVKGEYLFLEGSLSVSSYNNKLYLNLWVAKAIPQTAHTESIQGKLTVRGYVGKKTHHHMGDKLKEFVTFSIASSDGAPDKRVTTWVDCLLRPTDGIPDFMKGSLVEVTGELSAKYFREKLDLQCVVKTMEMVNRNHTTATV